MRSTPIAVICIGLFLVTCGCRAGRAKQHLVLLERENRNLEDALFQLEYDLEVCREEKAALSEGLSQNYRAERDAGPTRSSRSGRSEPDIGNLELPSVELGPPGTPSLEPPEKLRSPTPPNDPTLPEAPPYVPPSALPPKPSLAPPGGDQEMSHEQSASLHQDLEEPLADSTLVARLIIDSSRTRGFDADADSDPDGIEAFIQTRGGDDQPLRAAGPISVALLDPALPGEAARVARWDFSADEVARAYNRSPSAEGLKLKMRWPGAPPVNDRLQVFVRYTTGDGRQYESDSELNVDPPERPAQGWAATKSPDVESQTASRPTGDWKRRQVQNRSPVQVEAEPKPLPAVEEPVRAVTEPVRVASRPAKREPAPTPRPEPEPPARKLPAWSPNR